MPIYEYQCKGCGKVIEVLEKSGSGEHVCPDCGREKMERIFSAFGVEKGGSRSSGSCPTGTCPYS